jgi:DNA repair exonuclease SbcCD ATPase subunit
MQELKEHYAAAKVIANEASTVKEEVRTAKADLERRRLRRSAADIAAGGDGTGTKPGASMDSKLCDELSEDERIAEQIRVKTAQYKKSFDELRERKQMIEALHARLEHSRKQMAVCLSCYMPAGNGFFI